MVVLFSCEGSPNSADARDEPVVPTCSGFPVVASVKLYPPYGGLSLSFPCLMYSKPNLNWCPPWVQVKPLEKLVTGLSMVFAVCIPGFAVSTPPPKGAARLIKVPPGLANPNASIGARPALSS